MSSLRKLCPDRGRRGRPAPRDAGAAAPIASAVLPNGVTVVTRERPGSQVLAIDVAVRAGARYETGADGQRRPLPGERPDARYRALADRGTPWSAPIAGRGGDLSVTAGREIVEVSVTVGLPDAELALDVLGEVMLRSRFDPEDAGARARGDPPAGPGARGRAGGARRPTCCIRRSSPATRSRTCRTAPRAASKR